MRIFHYQLLSREILFFQRSLFRYGNKRWCPVCGWKFSFGQDDHVRLYGMDFMQRRESEGFKVESTDIWRIDLMKKTVNDAVSQKMSCFIM